MQTVLDYTLQQSSGPEPVEPVTLDEVKAWMNFEYDRDDELIRGIIQAARHTVETDTRLSLLTQTWIARLHSDPACNSLHFCEGSKEGLKLTHGPLASVTSITYLDEDGASQTWSSSNYEVDTKPNPGVIWLAYDASWPTVRDTQNAVTITYVVGYSATSNDRRYRLARQAMLMLIAHWYQNREAIAPGNMKAIEHGYNNLIEHARLRT